MGKPRCSGIFSFLLSFFSPPLLSFFLFLLSFTFCFGYFQTFVKELCTESPSAHHLSSAFINSLPVLLHLYFTHSPVPATPDYMLLLSLLKKCVTWSLNRFYFRLEKGTKYSRQCLEADMAKGLYCSVWRSF